mmetsp:Transcript_2849/g.8697  ORF Transcript_2849/g.8697 Transcript_2849/m.8697 type:complete len:404 (+) Transcript_2849:128-1339(+)|eukprot:CAMPEP_0198730478 /NCGR_PEP_ID=MMETSP1475-20131203/24683_1 /TAXON_ID= ORGANISM="Unidentified sp., Strain CCMP1999" /NCGR_SAMPLE_ID=MMETSP1475 /ASSEMBLY_ACC=CAM_ASM_001111 /LENGTH=403 /DNA_ID=CAMNT_0044493289 /DNA_START=64 /DNA_END=1275 /DNA_ORIENTATION=-
MERPNAGESVVPTARDSITCMACRVQVGSDTLREHYRSDWHRVNLKRRVANVGPISAGEFEQRVAELQDQQSKEQTKKEKGARKAFVCETCTKRFSSEKALQQHERSRRHIDKVREMNGQLNDEVHDTGEEAADDTEDEMDERIQTAQPIPSTECLFCGAKAPDEEHNVSHMAKTHGFFIHYIESLVNLSALLDYLGEKVGVGYACVLCSKSFTSVASVRRHMSDKNHSHMVNDDDAWFREYGEFYAWEEEDGEEGEEEEEGEWEEVTGEEREQAIARAKAGESVFETPSGLSTQELSTISDDTALELVLKSGGRAGHRSMLRYYKQNPRPKETRDSVLLGRVMGQYKLIGGGNNTSRQAAMPSRKELERKFKLDNLIAKRQYYINKTRTNTNMTVLNSGYRP